MNVSGTTGDTMESVLHGMSWQLQDIRFQLCCRNVRDFNSNIKNPLAPITPAQMRHLVHGAIQPDSNRFPRNAKEFYLMRNPKTKRQRDMLKYLVEFYGLQTMVDASDNEDENNPRQVPIVERPHLVVEVLEGTLGLREENFVNFHRRAREVAHERRFRPYQVKRPHGGTQDAPYAKRVHQKTSSAISYRQPPVTYSLQHK